jgi:hypothetical protein
VPILFNLSRLVADLMTERDLRQDFNRRPLQVMRSYNLDDQERRVLYTMDPPTISNFMPPPLDAQVLGFGIPGGEFHAEDENCLPYANVTMAQYPAPTPMVFRVSPREIQASDKTGAGMFEVVVHGQSFSRNPNAIIRLIDTNGTSTDGEAPFVFGTMRCSRVRCVFGVAAGTYEVRVFNSPGTAEQVEAEQPDPMNPIAITVA